MPGFDTFYIKWFHSFPRYKWGHFQKVTNEYDGSSEVCFDGGGGGVDGVGSCFFL